MFTRIKTALLLRKAWKQMDLAKFKSVKFWTAIVLNALIAFAATFLQIDLDPERAAQLITLITGGYLGGQAAADWRKNTIARVRGNFASRKLIIAFVSSVLVGFLTQAGLDASTATQIISLIGAMWFPAQAAADFGKEKEILSEAQLYASAQRARSERAAGEVRLGDAASGPSHHPPGTYTVIDEGILPTDRENSEQ